MLRYNEGTTSHVWTPAQLFGNDHTKFFGNICIIGNDYIKIYTSLKKLS